MWFILAGENGSQHSPVQDDAMQRSKQPRKYASRSWWSAFTQVDNLKTATASLTCCKLQRTKQLTVDTWSSSSALSVQSVSSRDLQRLKSSIQEQSSTFFWKETNIWDDLASICGPRTSKNQRANGVPCCATSPRGKKGELQNIRWVSTIHEYYRWSGM